MRTEAYYRGHTIGWDMAAAYFCGTRADRRAIRKRLARMKEANWSRFVEGVIEAFGERCEDRANAILDGIAKRTINPHKLRRVLDRMD